MTSTILLIRHAVTESNIKKIYQGASEEDVADKGVVQINQLCKKLKNIPITAVYSSPLKRTHTTAASIAKDHRLFLDLRENLKEIDFGLWEGLTKKETRQKWPEIWEELILDPGKITLPEGESFKKAMGRSIQVLEELKNAHGNGCIVIVTHNIIIKMIVIHMLKTSTNSYNRFQIDCASITKITTVNNISKIICLNDTSHLTEI